MFTGLVQTQGVLVSFEPTGAAWSLTVEAQNPLKNLEIGASIAVNGACLTLTAQSAANPKLLSFDVLEETRRCTQLGTLKPGALVNLEPSLCVGDPLGGHFVSGHIDGIGAVLELLQQGVDTYLKVRLDHPQNACYLVPKGSVALNGVSLTVFEVDASSFSVWLIPHTLSFTNLGLLKPGDGVNLEYDLLAKYIAKQWASGGKGRVP